MERGKFKIIPPDGTRVCRPISLDKRQLGRVTEEGKIMDYKNMKYEVNVLNSTFFFTVTANRKKTFKVRQIFPTLV